MKLFVCLIMVVMKLLINTIDSHNNIDNYTNNNIVYLSTLLTQY